MLHARLLDDWNKRSAADFAALFEEDGNQVGFDGSQVNGRGEIKSHLSAIFADHMTARYVGKVREVRFLSPETAVLRAVIGMIPPGKTDINPATNAIQTLVAVKREGQWREVAKSGEPITEALLDEYLSNANWWEFAHPAYHINVDK